MKLRSHAHASFWSRHTAPTSLTSDAADGNTCTTLVRLLISQFMRSQTLLVLTQCRCSRGNARQASAAGAASSSSSAPRASTAEEELDGAAVAGAHERGVGLGEGGLERRDGRRPVALPAAALEHVALEVGDAALPSGAGQRLAHRADEPLVGVGGDEC